MTPSLAPALPLWLLFTIVFLSLGLLVGSALAAVIKALFLRKRVGAYRDLMRGVAISVSIAVLALLALGYAGVNLHDRPFGDLLWNGAATVSIGALGGLLLEARKLFA